MLSNKTIPLEAAISAVTTLAGQTKRLREIVGQTKRLREIAGQTKRLSELVGQTKRLRVIRRNRSIKLGLFYDDDRHENFRG